MKTIIHVNQHVIKKNKKTGESAPVLSVKTYRSTRYAHTVCGDGPWVIRYQPHTPLSCGAHVWLEVDSETIGGSARKVLSPIINRRPKKKL